MKPIKRRIDIRLKKSLFERITTISDKLEKTWTDVIEEALAYGLKWYEAKIKRELDAQEKQPVQTQQNNTPQDEDDERPVSDEEVKRALDELYKHKNHKKR